MKPTTTTEISTYDDNEIVNPSTNLHMDELIAVQLSRRQALKGGMSVTAAALLGGLSLSACGGGSDDAPAPLQLGFKAVAASADHQDGEEGQFLVIPRRIEVQEAVPLWISKAGEKTFDFEKLTKSGRSDSLRHLGLTVQMTSNPAWYAVQALPTLMEYPYECSEQTFSRLYGKPGRSRKGKFWRWTRRLAAQ